MSDDGEKFLSRWSRLKRDTTVAEPGATQPLALDQGAATPLQRQENDAHADSVPPSLPPVDELTLESDFSGFFHPKVGEDVRRAALKKLFSDPHFNVMDGLDTYIDDYSISDPLPAEMLAQMKSAQKIFKWARNEREEGEEAPAQLDSATTPALDVAAPASALTQGQPDELVVPQPLAALEAKPSEPTEVDDKQ